jgi:hypothetical protein
MHLHPSCTQSMTGGGGRTIKFLLPSSNAHCHFYRLGCSFVPYRVGCSFVQSSCFHPLSCNAFFTGTQLCCVWTPPCPRQLAMRMWNPSWILSGSQRCGAAPRSVLTPSVGPHPPPPPQVHSSVLTLTCLSRPLPIPPPFTGTLPRSVWILPCRHLPSTRAWNQSWILLV